MAPFDHAKVGGKERWRMTDASGAGGLTVVVIAGAVARGAYEAAALTAILPRILPNLESTIILGTSAGAINAVLWAQGASKGRPLDAVGAEVEAVWKTIHRDDVFAILSADPITTRLRGQSPHGLLDAPARPESPRSSEHVTAEADGGADH